jgi:hypothetical protein
VLTPRPFEARPALVSDPDMRKEAIDDALGPSDTTDGAGDVQTDRNRTAFSDEDTEDEDDDRDV